MKPLYVSEIQYSTHPRNIRFKDTMMKWKKLTFFSMTTSISLPFRGNFTFNGILTCSIVYDEKVFNQKHGTKSFSFKYLKYISCFFYHWVKCQQKIYCKNDSYEVHIFMMSLPEIYWIIYNYVTDIKIFTVEFHENKVQAI